MLNTVLMFVGGALAFVIVVTLVIAYFMTRRHNEAIYELDVLNIRVPSHEYDGALGKKDAMSIVLTAQYFDMIKKMGASSSTSTP